MSALIDFGLLPLQGGVIPLTPNRGRQFNTEVGYLARGRLATDSIGNFTLTLTDLAAGSDIVVLDAGTSTERVNVDANAGTSYAFVHGFFPSGGNNVDIGVFKAGYVPFYVRNYPLAAGPQSLPIAQVVDRGYSNP